VHGVHVVLQGHEAESAFIKSIDQDSMDGLIGQPLAEVIEEGAVSGEPCAAILRGVEAAHSVKVGIA
jgi:hypothetical protein